MKFAISATPSRMERSGSCTIYMHKELFAALRKVLAASRGTRAPQSPSEFFRHAAIDLIKRKGARAGVRLPADLEN